MTNTILKAIIISFIFCSCNRQKIDFKDHLWVNDIAQNSKRILCFEKINDSLYFFHSGILTNGNIDSSKDATENYICGVINSNKENSIVLSDYNLFNEFHLDESENTLSLKFEKEFRNNQYFPKEKNRFKVEYPVKFTFRKDVLNGENELLFSLYRSNFFDNEEVNNGRLRDELDSAVVDLYKYPYSNISQKISVKPNDSIRYNLILANYSRDKSEVFYDTTTFFNISIFQVNANGDVGVKSGKYYEGWIRKDKAGMIKNVKGLDL